MAQPAPAIEKLLYGRKDAAYALSVSPRTIDRMIANQVLKTRRFGGRVMIPAAEVKAIADRVIRCDMLQGSASVVPKHRRPSPDRNLKLVRTRNNEPGKTETEQEASRNL